MDATLSQNLSLDEIDLAILRVLQGNARISNGKLAEAVGLSESPCWRRVKRLESIGLISAYRTILNRRLLGYGAIAFVNVRISNHDLRLAEEFEQAVRAMEDVMSCHNVTGETDYVLQVVAQDLDAYGRLTVELRKLPGVTAIHSSLSLREVKSTTSLPLHRYPVR